MDFPTPPFALDTAIVNLVQELIFGEFFGSSLLFIAALSSGFLSDIKVSLLVFWIKTLYKFTYVRWFQR